MHAREENTICLLTVIHRTCPQVPLIFAANRDEVLSRPATAMTVLQAGGPRILGGRDHQAGGTWLAVNEHGVMAGLTNRPDSADGPARRSRGELPLALAGHASAAAAVDAFVQTFRPGDFRPGWLLAGDGRDLFSIDMTGGEAPAVTRLPPGVHVLENRPPGSRSPKAARTGHLMLEGLTLRRPQLLRFLEAMLSSHLVPAGATAGGPGAEPPRPAAHQTACVHAGSYGTRSAFIGMLDHLGQPPHIMVADGPPCRTPFRDVTDLWRQDAAE